MRLVVSLKNFSLALAMISFMSAAVASAQSLVGVNTELVSPLDSQTAAQGQAVTVKLDNSVKTPDGVKLPRGTELVGKITSASPAASGKPASVTIVFTAAQLKGGKQIPVKATVIAAYPGDQGEEAQYADATMDTVAGTIPGDRTIDQEPGALPGVSLTAAVQDPASGTFTKKAGNFKLATGTYLQIGVAAASATTSAE